MIVMHFLLGSASICVHLWLILERYPSQLICLLSLAESNTFSHQYAAQVY